MKNNTLVIFTSSFPYQGGEQFLETEIEFLAKEFDKIIIVPAKKSNTIRKIPKNVMVDDYVAQIDKNIFNRLISLFSVDFTRNISYSKNELKILSINMLYVRYVKKWLSSNIVNINLSKTVFYTYWFGAQTSALYLMKTKYPQIKYITRVHGGDLYESVHNIKYFPFREKIMQNINFIFPISTNGKKHVKEKYIIASNKLIVSRLGVKEHSKINKPSNDGVFRIVSCSSIISVKRVELIVKMLSKMNNSKIEWMHFGDGHLKEEISKLANTILASNIKYTLKGFVDNSYIYDFYENNPIDLFINCSSSEGIPVSIMESQSFAIPVMATDVGGTSEIVDNRNGYLIKSDAKILDTMINTLNYILENKEEHNEKREKSLEIFLDKYSADKNYEMLIKELKKI